MTTAARFVAHSLRPSCICSWTQAARALYGATVSRGVARFADGSAVTFTPAGKPVEYIGA
jgi:hypothetical protein